MLTEMLRYFLHLRCKSVLYAKALCFYTNLLTLLPLGPLMPMHPREPGGPWTYEQTIQIMEIKERLWEATEEIFS